MRPTNSQLRRVEELATRLLTNRGADQLIRALLVIDGGVNRDDIKLGADPELVAALRPHTIRADAPDNGPTLHRFLRDARHNVGINQSSAAKRVGVQQTTYSAWETGHTIPPAGRVDALSRVLGIPPRILEEQRERAVTGRRG